MIDNQNTPKHFQARNVSWLTIVFALLAIISFVMISQPNRYYATPMAVGGGVMESSSGGYPSMSPSGTSPMRDASVTTNSIAPDMKSGGAYYPSPYYYNQEVPATDTREFLKINYNASLRTRDVQGVTRHVETMVRGHGGRIDQESSSKEWGYVSFALQKSHYDAFRTELESLVDSRFLTVNISSQNLLPQKQSVEEQQKQADARVSDVKASRQKIVSTHASTVQSLQSKIDADASEIARLRAQTSTPQIDAQILALTNEWTSLKQQLVNENSSYAKQLSSADSEIKYAQDWQKAVQTQDKTLIENVETVTGTVSLQWISLWDMAQVYLPGYWIPTIFLGLTILSLLWDRRRFATTVVTA